MKKKTCLKCNCPVEPGAVRCQCGAILNSIENPPITGTARAESIESIEKSSADNSTHTGSENHEVAPAHKGEHKGETELFHTIRPELESDEPADSERVSTAKSDQDDKNALSNPSTDTASKGSKERSPNGVSPSPLGITPQTPSSQSLTSSESIFQRINERSVAIENYSDDEAVDNTADYLLKSQVGEGSFGYVYIASQRVLNRSIAIKQLKPTALIDTSMLSGQKKQDADRRNRRTIRKFFFEAEINGRLDYPNIPAIFELGHSVATINKPTEKPDLTSKGETTLHPPTQSFGYFYSMKLIEGEDWQKSITRRARGENLKIFEVIAKAVAYAHEEGVIHRDLKPENVMIGRYDEIFLTDWGMARDLHSKDEIPAGGSPEFMAPEATISYKANEAHDIDERSDVYSLGAILYRIVAKKPSKLFPETIGKLELFKAIRTTPIRDSDSKDPLLQVALKAMATNPKDRYPSVKAMLSAIEVVNEHQESLRITERTKETTQQAIDQRDYNLFNQALFGFQDAIRRWPENNQAAGELRHARYAYGKCAFDKGDYDLVLQTLDRSVADEETLCRSAQSAQIAVQNRANRFRLLRNAFILSLIAGIAGMSWLAARNNKLAISNKNIAESEKRQREIAVEKTIIAEEKTIIAEDKTKIAEENAAEAKRQTNNAIVNAFLADVNKAEAVDQKGLAERNAVRARDELENSTIASDLQQLESAHLGATQFNFIQANQLLKKLQNLDPSPIVGGKSGSAEEPLPLFEQGRPSLDNWALRRVKLISNNDLQKLPLGDNVQSIEYSAKTGVGIVVYKDGTLGRLDSIKDPLGTEQWQVQKIIFDQQPNLMFNKVVISPLGNEAVLLASNKQGDDRGALCLLDLSNREARPQIVSELGNQAYEAACYDPTGEILLAGISNGMALRDRSGKWIAQSIARLSPDQTDTASAKVLAQIKGNLIDLCWESSGDTAYILVRSAVQSTVVNNIVKISGFKTGSLKMQPIDVSEDVRESAESIAWLPSAILIGHNDGRLGTYGFRPTSEQQAQSELFLQEFVGGQSKLHKRSVKEILVLAADAIKDSRGRSFGYRWVASRSDEPSGHLWRVDANGLLTHVTAFGGTMGPDSIDSSISQMASLDKAKMFLVDASGMAVVSDLARVSQRLKLSRNDASGKSLQKPIVDIHMRGATSTAIAVNTDGVVDLWDAQTGETLRFNQDRWESYFGHSPGSKWFGTAVDPEAGVVLTARTSTLADDSQASQVAQRLEFCVWDLATKQMLRSWSIKKEALDQPIVSILGSGQFMLSGSVLRVFDYFGNDVTDSLGLSRFMTASVSETVLGPNVHFAVRNPKFPNVLAMTKIRGDYSGVAWIWRRDASTGQTLSWFDQERNQTPEKFIQGRPLEGVWSSDGLRFYLLDDLGWVSQLVLDSPESTFSIDSAGPRFSLEIDQKGKPLQRRIASGINTDSVDIKVETKDGVDRVEVLIREYQRRKGSTADSSSDRYVFDVPLERSAGGIEIARQAKRSVDGLSWLDQQVTDSIHPGSEGLKVSADKRPRSIQRVGGELLVSTAANELYVRELDSSKGAKVLGRKPILSSACDWAGNELFTLHTDGSIWQLSLADLQKARWERYGYEIGDNRSIESGSLRLISTPKGDWLGIHDLSKNTLQMITRDSGKLAGSLTDVKAIAWRDGPENRGAIVYTDGTIELFDGTPKSRSVEQPSPLKIRLEELEQVDACDFFIEKLDRAKDGPTVKEYLLVRTIQTVGKDRSEQGVRFHYVPLLGPVLANYFIWPPDAERQNKEGASKTAVSMKDSTIVTSDTQGGLQVWYASPSYKLMRPVFGIPSEQDGEILEICFSRDGKTLITSDNKGRLSGWMAEDQTQTSR